MKAASYFLLLSLTVFALPWACTKTLNSPVTAISTPTPAFTPTATTVVVSAPITISVTSANLYSVNGTAGPAISAPITVVSGQMIVFDTSNATTHQLYIDNGSGICSVTPSNISSYPYFYYPTGPSGTNFTFHCSIHGTCNGGSAICTLPCTGMTGVFHVQ